MDRVLLISNANAGGVSARTRAVIAKALSADCKLDEAATARRDHATALAADAVDRGFDAVVVFGGDGTLNEVAQALVGSDVALGILPGGSTNVLARTLGMPIDPVDATAFVGDRLKAGSRRRIGLGKVDERYFLFSAGMGLDAAVVKRFEANPAWRGRNYHWHFLRAALKVGATEYRGADPAITLSVEGRDPQRVLLAICCNARPFTYFARWPVDVCPEASLGSALDLYALDRIRASYIPRLIWSVFVSRSHTRWRHASYDHDITEATLTADAPLPVQVDGDYIGEHGQVRFAYQPDALTLLI